MAALEREIANKEREYARLGREMNKPGQAMACAAWRADLVKEIAAARAKMSDLAHGMARGA